MRRARRAYRLGSTSFVTGAALAACSFTRGSAPESDAADAPIAPPCDAPSYACADALSLRASCAGAEDVVITCSWGCIATTGGAHCGELVPSGGGVVAADLDSTGLGDVSLAGTINGSTGQINGSAAASLGAAFRQGSNNVGVFRFNRLDISDLKLQGTRAIALVADGAIAIDGVIDARGPCNDGAGDVAGAGGSDGGNESDGDGSGGGIGGDTPNRGAGGAGHGAAGGSGGGGVAGGSSFGDNPIAVLVGGAGGGGAKTTSRGGGGGGAIHIVSNTSIAIAAGAGINAGGCGGLGGDGNDDAGGGGGGAGGTVLLEAPRITLAGTIAANGGGGGNRNGGDGSAGRLDRTRASGATGGGSGGAGSAFGGGAGSGSGSGQSNGGGGGAVGRIRLNTPTGAASELVRTGATLSPDLGDGPTTTTTHGPAKTR